MRRRLANQHGVAADRADRLPQDWAVRADRPAASAGDDQLSLSWNNPSNAAINKYRYQVSSDGGTTWSPEWTDISGSGSATTTYTVSSLTNGTADTVEGRAVGDGGDLCRLA